MAPPATIAAAVDGRSWSAVSELARTGLASPVTTSAGRLFDAVAALCGVRTRVNYEGQAAVELEAACDPLERARLPAAAGARTARGSSLDARAAVAAVVEDLEAGVRVGPGRRALPQRASPARRPRRASSWPVQRDLYTVALSGGTFQNRVLLERVAADLRRSGLRVLIPERLPPNDGGISYGQAAVAAARGGSRPARTLLPEFHISEPEQQGSAREDERSRERLTSCPVCLHCSR